METVQQVVDVIKNIQDSAVVCSGINKTNLDEEMCLDLCENDKVKYTIYVNDDPVKKHITKFAVFIVPHGRQVHRSNFVFIKFTSCVNIEY